MRSLLWVTRPVTPATNQVKYRKLSVMTLDILCRRSEIVQFDTGDAGPIIAGDDDRPGLLKNEASLQDAVFGVSINEATYLAEHDAMRWQPRLASSSLTRILSCSACLVPQLGYWSFLQVLFTITEEKLNNSWKYAMTVLLLDVLQVLAHDSAWN